MACAFQENSEMHIVFFSGPVRPVSFRARPFCAGIVSSEDVLDDCTVEGEDDSVAVVFCAVVDFAAGVGAAVGAAALPAASRETAVETAPIAIGSSSARSFGGAPSDHRCVPGWTLPPESFGYPISHSSGRSCTNTSCTNEHAHRCLHRDPRFH